MVQGSPPVAAPPIRDLAATSPVARNASRRRDVHRDLHREGNRDRQILRIWEPESNRLPTTGRPTGVSEPHHNALIGGGQA